MERYSRQRHLINQKKLGEGRVMVVGVGGLGSASVTLLAMAGVGELLIVDYDVVETSNLNRQILYREKDVGKMKVEVAKKRIEEINPHVKVNAINKKISKGFKIPHGVDIVVDGLDNFEARFIVEKASIESKIPYVFGAVEGYMGMVTFIDKNTKRLRDLFKNLPQGDEQVLASTVMLTASIQSMEVIKFLSDRGDLLRNRLIIYDGLSTNYMEVRL